MNVLNKVLGRFKRDKGINQAVNHADTEIPVWSDQAYDYLKEFDKDNDNFMTEQVRMASVGTVPEPPSNRAWGGVMLRGKRAGIIFNNGFRATSNPKAHCTPATVWTNVDLPF